MSSDENQVLAAPSQRSSILQNLGHLLSSQLATWVLSTLVAIVVPRHIGPAGQGQLRLGLSLWAIAQAFAGLGTDGYLSLQVARDRARGMSLLGPVIVLRMLAFLATTIPLVVYVLAVDVDGTFVVVLVLLGVGALCDLVTGSIASAMMGLEQMAGPARSLVISKATWSLSVCTAVLLGGGVRWVAFLTFVGSALNLVLLRSVLRKVHVLKLGRWRVGARAALHGSMGFFAASAILILYQQIDTIIIALLVEEETLGWYATADGLFGSLLFLPTVTVMALYPVMARLWNEDREALGRLVERVSMTLLVAAVPIGVGTSIVGPNLAPLLFGEEFRETGEVLVALGPVITFVFFTTLIGSFALATDRRTFWNLLMLSAAFLTIPLDLVLVPWADRTFDNGAIGGALAYVVTESSMLVIGLVVIAPALLNRRVASRLVRTLAAAGLMFAVAWPLRDVFVAVPVAAGAVVYAVAVVVLRVFGRNEVDMVRNMVRGGGGRAATGAQ